MNLNHARLSGVGGAALNRIINAGILSAVLNAHRSIENRTNTLTLTSYLVCCVDEYVYLWSILQELLHNHGRLFNRQASHGRNLSRPCTVHDSKLHGLRNVAELLRHFIIRDAVDNRGNSLVNIATTRDDVCQILCLAIVHQNDGLLRLKVKVIQGVARRRNKSTSYTRIAAARHVLHRGCADRESTGLGFHCVDVTMNYCLSITHIIQLNGKGIQKFLSILIGLDLLDEWHTFIVQALHLYLIQLGVTYYNTLSEHCFSGRASLDLRAITELRKHVCNLLGRVDVEALASSLVDFTLCLISLFSEFRDELVLIVEVQHNALPLHPVGH